MCSSPANNLDMAVLTPAKSMHRMCVDLGRSIRMANYRESAIIDIVCKFFFGLSPL